MIETVTFVDQRLLYQRIKKKKNSGNFKWLVSRVIGPPPPQGRSQKNWVPKILTLFKTKICDICYPIILCNKILIP